MQIMKQIDHNEWLRKRGLLPKQIKSRKTKSKSWLREYSDSLKVDRSTAQYDSVGLSGKVSACPNRSIMANLHKESEETRQAILDKANRIGPLWNKGGLMLITDGQDLTTLGKKV